MKSSDAAFAVFCEIAKQYPSVYRIKGKYYLISNDVFQECTSEEQQLYEALRREYWMLGDDENITKLKYSKDKEALKALADIYNQLKHAGNTTEASAVMMNCRKLANTMSNQDVDNLKDQLETYCKIAELSNYYDIPEEIKLK